MHIYIYKDGDSRVEWATVQGGETAGPGIADGERGVKRTVTATRYPSYLAAVPSTIVLPAWAWCAAAGLPLPPPPPARGTC